ncbi:hypothetical protein [Mycobacterium tuberculosis]|uniref:hypothetical protein n=1 Tax=Mycobacterium tuberculosis TaxID=1773 RepID=UPI000D349AD8|nr:hypothetical protein [Mycobacterium tuberculosis]
MKTTTPAEPLFDCVAVHIGTRAVPILVRNQTARNVEAYRRMPVARRGVALEFFAETAAGTYQEGEAWTGKRDHAIAQATAPK